MLILPGSTLTKFDLQDVDLSSKLSDVPIEIKPNNFVMFTGIGDLKINLWPWGNQSNLINLQYQIMNVQGSNFTMVSKSALTNTIKWGENFQQISNTDAQFDGT